MKRGLSELKDRRLREGSKPADLARLLGCWQPLVSLWERGYVTKPIKSREKLAYLLGVSVKEVWQEDVAGA